MKKLMQVLGYGFLFVMLFGFFSFISFPYEVLKETISGKLSQATGMTIHFNEMAPVVPLGISVKDVSISDGMNELKVASARVSVGIFSLFLLKACVYVDLATNPNGALNLKFCFKFLDLLASKVIPADIRIDGKDFGLGSFANFGLAVYGSSQDANPMITPLLQKIIFNSNLNAKIDLSLNTSNLTSSVGDLSIDLKGTTLVIDDPSLNIPEQVFKKASIKAGIRSGKLTIDNKSGLESDQISIDMSGSIGLRENVPTAPLDIKVLFELRDALKNQFGFLLSAMGSGGGDGPIEVRVGGTIGAPRMGG